MNTKKGMTIACIAVALSAVMWGLDGVALTPKLFNLDVAFIVFLLHLVPFMLMNLFLYGEYKHLSTFSKEDYLYFSLMALSGGVIGTLAIVKALMLINFQPLSIVVLLQKLQPVFAIALAAILLKEKLTKHFALWAAIALAAGYTLTFGFGAPNLATGINTVYAALYAVLAAAAFGSATVFGRKILLKHSFTTATFYRFGLTSLFMLVFVAATQKFQFDSITSMNWMFLFLIAFTTGGSAIMLYYYGLTKITAMMSTILELFFPISAIFFDYIFNHNVLTLVQWVSAAVMVGAIVKITLDSGKANST